MSTDMNAGQAGQAAQSPSSAGQPDDYKAKLDQLEKDKQELERAVKGIKADLISEREKRQQLEQVRQAPVPAGNPVVDPVDNLLQSKFQQYAAPLVNEVSTLKQELAMQKAFHYIAKQEKMDPDDVPNSDAFKDVVRIAQERGIRGSDPLHEAKLAYELLVNERKGKAEAAAHAEAERVKAISGQGTISSTAPAAPTVGGQITEKDLRDMRSGPQLSETIQAIKAGKLKLVP